MLARLHISAVGAPDVCSSARLAASASKLLRRSLTWLLPLGTALIYLCFRTRNYYWDGITFAFSIEQSSGLSRSLIHPPHLLYNLFGYATYQLVQAAGWHIRTHPLRLTEPSLDQFFADFLPWFSDGFSPQGRTRKDLHNSQELNIAISGGKGDPFYFGSAG
jgi:hypothetical protein